MKLSFFYYPQPIGKMKVISLFSLSLIGLMAMVSGLSAKHHEGDDLRDFGTKLKQAVQEGKLSKEDAMAKWKAAAQKIKEERDRKGGHDEAKSKMMEAIKRAVEQGKLSEREAKAKWMAIRGEHGDDHHDGDHHHDDHHEGHHDEHEQDDLEEMHLEIERMHLEIELRKLHFELEKIEFDQDRERMKWDMERMRMDHDLQRMHREMDHRAHGPRPQRDFRGPVGPPKGPPRMGLRACPPKGSCPPRGFQGKGSGISPKGPHSHGARPDNRKGPSRDGFGKSRNSIKGKGDRPIK